MHRSYTATLAINVPAVPYSHDNQQTVFWKDPIGGSVRPGAGGVVVFVLSRQLFPQKRRLAQA